MQKFKLKDKMSGSLLAVLTALFVCFNPGDAFADLLGCMQSQAGAGIFKIIACKVTTTLFDIRKIVYILGGFGLIAFTFAAIFNKISFKHLAHIALSLFLLSMMTPFIEYFTRDEGAPGLTYGHFLQPDFSEADYSTTFGECQGGDCPVSTTASGSGTTLPGGGTGGFGGAAGGAGGLIPGADGKVLPAISGGPLGGSIASMAGGGVDLKTITLNPVAGPEVDTRTGWQKFKDTIKSVKDETVKAYNTASTAVSVAKTVYNAVDGTISSVKNAEGIGGIINAGVNAADNYTTVTGAITSGAGSLGTNYTDKEGKKTLGEKVDDFFKGRNQRANEGKEVLQDMGQINATTEGIKDLPNDVKDIFR